MKRKLLLGGLLLILGAVALSFQSFFLVSNSYPTNTVVSESLDVGIDERSDYGQVNFISEIKRNGESIETIENTTVEGIIGTQEVYTINKGASTIEDDLGSYLTQHEEFYLNQFVPKEYQDFDKISMDISIGPGKGKGSGNHGETSMNIYYKLDSSNNVPNYLEGYTVDMSFMIDWENDYYEYDITRSSSTGSIYHEGSGSAEQFNETAVSVITSKGQIRFNESDNQFELYDELEGGEPNEIIEFIDYEQYQEEIPQPFERYDNGISDYTMNLSTVDLRIEEGKINDIISVKMNGEEVIGKIDWTKINDDTYRIRFDKGVEFVYQDSLEVEFEGFKPRKDMGYLLELDGYGTIDQNVSTGIRVFESSEARSSSSVVEVSEFSRTFEEEGEYEFVTQFEGPEGVIKSRTKDFQIYNPSSPPAIFNELVSHFSEFLGN